MSYMQLLQYAFCILLAICLIEGNEEECCLSVLPGLSLKPDVDHIPSTPALRKQIKVDAKSKTWEKSVSLMKEILDRRSVEYKQLQEIKDRSDLPLEAVRKNYMDIIRVLLRNELPINTLFDINAFSGKNKYSMLHQAVTKGHNAIAFLLIKEGADIHQRTYNESTPLMIAAGYNNLKIVKLLTELGADVNAVDKNGNTVLHRAKILGERNQAVIDYLIKSGCDETIKNNDGKTYKNLVDENKKRRN